MAHAWRILDIVLVLSTVVFAVVMLEAATSLTANGFTLLSLLILSPIPLLFAIAARMAQALLPEQEFPWRSGAVDGGILLLHPLIVAAVFLLTHCSDWALETRFTLSRASLERAAAQIALHPNVTSEKARWIGLYRIEAVRVDAEGRVHFELGDCSMFANCDLEFDPATDCASRGWREYRALDRHWCRVVHDHL